MKKFIFFARVSTWLSLVLPLAASAQDSLDTYPNYVVIGAFASHNNAIHFTEDANKNSFPAKFQMNPNRNLYYVYVITTDDREYAFAEALRLRTDTKYFDTWVYSGVLGDIGSVAGGGNQDFDPVTGRRLGTVGNADPSQNAGGAKKTGTSSDQQMNGQASGNLSQNLTPDNELSTENGTRSTDGSTSDNGSTANSAPTGNDGSSLQDGLASNNAAATNKGSKRKNKSNAKNATTADQGSTPDNGSTNNTPTRNDQATSNDGSIAQNGSTSRNDPTANNSSALQNGSVLDSALPNNIAAANNRTTANPGSRQKNGSAGNEGSSTTSESPLNNSSLANNSSTLESGLNSKTEAATNNPSTANNGSTGNQGSPLNNGSTDKSGSTSEKESALTNQSTSTNSTTPADGLASNNGSARVNGSAADNGSTSNDPSTSDNAGDAQNGSQETQSAVKTGTTGTRNSDRDRLPLPGPPPVRATTAPLSAEDVTAKDFYFYLFRADNHNMVPGDVDAIDFEKSRRMATYEANVPVKVIMPSGKTKQISFVCQVFGYRKLQREFIPSEPASDLYLDDKGNVVVPFELIRLQKGDIAIMYNVFFFKDAAVMRPESRFEVNNLLDLLLENPGYKIRIHGHTNGNAAGKIIKMGSSNNFYSLTDTKQGFGSAKQLSEDRAVVIRDFLISSGINADRMDVKAWGGKKPIHPKNSVRANENVRVEIEILSD